MVIIGASSGCLSLKFIRCFCLICYVQTKVKIHEIIINDMQKTYLGINIEPDSRSNLSVVGR